MVHRTKDGPLCCSTLAHRHFPYGNQLMSCLLAYLPEGIHTSCPILDRICARARASASTCTQCNPLLSVSIGTCSHALALFVTKVMFVSLSLPMCMCMCRSCPVLQCRIAADWHDRVEVGEHSTPLRGQLESNYA